MVRHKDVVDLMLFTMTSFERHVAKTLVASLTFLPRIDLLLLFFFLNFLNFWRTHVLFVGPLIPLFWTSGDVVPGFQSQGGLACMLSCLRAIPQIHLWCDTC